MNLVILIIILGSLIINCLEISRKCIVEIKIEVMKIISKNNLKKYREAFYFSYLFWGLRAHQAVLRANSWLLVLGSILAGVRYHISCLETSPSQSHKR